MALRLYNTLTGEIDDFKPISNQCVTLYTCGPTVYDYPHVGNWASFLYWDILVRVLIANGYNVERVMNITDVGHLVSDADEGEDKLEKGARREGKTAWEVAEYYAEDFMNGMQKLGLILPEHITKATDYIDQQLALVRTLKEKGYTYQTTDGIYFDTSKFPRYASFAHLDLAAQKAGARVEQNDEKRQPWDFALWKFTPAGQKRDMEWETPGDLLDISQESGIWNLESVKKAAPTAISYIMGQGEITLSDIEAIGGKIEQITPAGHLCVTFPLENAAEFEKLVTNKMTPGFWNEYLGSEKPVFIFKHKDGKTERFELDDTTEEKIRKLGNRFNNNQDDNPKENVWDWLKGNSWYANSPQLHSSFIIHDSAGKSRMGFPGWHLECSAMAMDILGETIDIHTGGIDHIPVHHTNEIAQSEAATGKRFANYWLHNNHLKIDGGKISKSLGNGYTLQDLEQRGFSALDLRMFVLQSQFINEGNFTFDNLLAAKNRLRSWQGYAALRHQTQDSLSTNNTEEFKNLLSANDNIVDSLNDNLNTPLALSNIDEAFSQLDNQPLQDIDRQSLMKLLAAIDQLLGLQLLETTPDITDAQKQLIAERESARANKDWQRSDELRDMLKNSGVTVRDTQFGPVWGYA